MLEIQGILPIHRKMKEQDIIEVPVPEKVILLLEGGREILEGLLATNNNL